MLSALVFWLESLSIRVANPLPCLAADTANENTTLVFYGSTLAVAGAS